jgi:hypothetical protein
MARPMPRVAPDMRADLFFIELDKKYP